MATDERVVPFGLAFIGIAAVCLSMFLPLWDEGSVSAFSGISKNTLLQSGTGWLTLIFAGVALVSLLRMLPAPRRTWWPVVNGVVAIGYAVYLGTSEDVLTLCPLTATRVTDACQVAEPGIGVYVLGVAGVALLGAGWMFLRFPKRDPKAVAPATDPMTLTRECPHCKSAIRPDATVCPHCRRESEPWTLHENTWWRHDEGGAWLRYEPLQPNRGWHPHGSDEASEQA